MAAQPQMQSQDQSCEQQHAVCTDTAQADAVSVYSMCSTTDDGDDSGSQRLFDSRNNSCCDLHSLDDMDIEDLDLEAFALDPSADVQVSTKGEVPQGCPHTCNTALLFRHKVYC